MSGYWKRFLKINLTDRHVEIHDLEDDLIERFLGGSGIASVMLHRASGPDTDPLSPENPLIAFTGPFTGTRVPSSARHHIVSRSPQTGVFGESNVGGSWGVLLRKAGYDGVVVTGRADAPVYLWIHEGGVEIREAGPIWGRDSFESADWLKNETTCRATVAVIGPAGERLASIAGIPHIGSIFRAAARTGLGAVMGSKQLKAMVVYGDGRPPVADPDGLARSTKARLEHIRRATETFGKYGTSGGVETYEKIGNFPIQNWRGSHWAGASKISGVAMHDTVLVGRRGCWRCPIACGRHIKIEKGPYAGLEGAGPEYESVGTLGGECMVDDLEALCQANHLCNQYGLDTISAGATVAFAMELYEKGLLSINDTDGIELTWGNAEALVEVIRKMGEREGIGELMSMGSKAMALALGGNADEFAIHVKGLEPSAHDPRRFFSQALSYCTSARGACHNASWSHPYELALTMPEIGIDQPQDAYQVEGKAEFTAKLQNFNCAMDCLIMCRFSQVGRAVTITNTAEWLSMTTGREIDTADLMAIGERVFYLKRLYNTNLGVTRQDDSLPPRFLKLNREAEDLTNQLPPIGELLSDYYRLRDWDETGVPRPEKLAALGLDEFANHRSKGGSRWPEKSI